MAHVAKMGETQKEGHQLTKRKAMNMTTRRTCTRNQPRRKLFTSKPMMSSWHHPNGGAATTINHFSRLILFIQIHGKAQDHCRTSETPANAARQFYPMPRGKRSVGFAAYLHMYMRLCESCLHLNMNHGCLFLPRMVKFNQNLLVRRNSGGAPSITSGHHSTKKWLLGIECQQRMPWRQWVLSSKSCFQLQQAQQKEAKDCTSSRSSCLRWWWQRGIRQWG